MSLNNSEFKELREDRPKKSCCQKLFDQLPFGLNTGIYHQGSRRFRPKFTYKVEIIVWLFLLIVLVSDINRVGSITSRTKSKHNYNETY